MRYVSLGISGSIILCALAFNLMFYLYIQHERQVQDRDVYIQQLETALKDSLDREKASRAVVVSRGTERTLSLEVTAYTNNDEGMDGRGITASGLSTDIGTLAVDPALIPLGTILHLEGVGYVIAMDTGGAIKGYKADLYFKDRETALQWGIRRVQATIIKIKEDE